VIRENVGESQAWTGDFGLRRALAWLVVTMAGCHGIRAGRGRRRPVFPAGANAYIGFGILHVIAVPF